MKSDEGVRRDVAAGNGCNPSEADTEAEHREDRSWPIVQVRNGVR